MTTGLREEYKYRCVVENSWITEERAEGSIPTVCKNSGHQIRDVSSNSKYANLKRTNQTDNFGPCDMTNPTLLDVHQKLEILAGRVRVLEAMWVKEKKAKFV